MILKGRLKLRMKYDKCIVKKPQDYHAARKKIKNWLQPLQSDQQFFFEVAVNEALNNTVHHGRNEEEIYTSISFESDGTKIIVSIEDRGSGLTKEAETLYRQASEEVFKRTANTLKQSGRGLAIMKECSDNMILEENGRRVTLIKYI